MRRLTAGIAVLAIGLPCLASCGDTPGDWSAIVYPDKSDRSNFYVTPRFQTASYCLESAKTMMEKIQVMSGGTYRCGYKCGSGTPRSMTVCEKYQD